MAFLFKLPQTLFSLIHVHLSENLISIFLTHLCINPLCVVWYLRNLSPGPTSAIGGCTKLKVRPSLSLGLRPKQIHTHKALRGGTGAAGRGNPTASQTWTVLMLSCLRLLAGRAGSLLARPLAVKGSHGGDGKSAWIPQRTAVVTPTWSWMGLSNAYEKPVHRLLLKYVSQEVGVRASCLQIPLPTGRKGATHATSRMSLVPVGGGGHTVGLVTRDLPFPFSLVPPQGCTRRPSGSGTRAFPTHLHPLPSLFSAEGSLFTFPDLLCLWKSNLKASPDLFCLSVSGCLCLCLSHPSSLPHPPVSSVVYRLAIHCFTGSGSLLTPFTGCSRLPSPGGPTARDEGWCISEA